MESTMRTSHPFETTGRFHHPTFGYDHHFTANKTLPTGTFNREMPLNHHEFDRTNYRFDYDRLPFNTWNDRYTWEPRHFDGFNDRYNWEPRHFGGFNDRYNWEPRHFEGFNDRYMWEPRHFGGFNDRYNWETRNFGDRFFYDRQFNHTNDWNTTLSSVNFRPTNPVELECLNNPIRVLDREGNRMVWLCFDLRGFKPEEIKVVLNKAERAIVVECHYVAKHEKQHEVTRTFTRRWVFPKSLEKIDLTTCQLRSYLDRHGMLVIECSLPRMTTEEFSRCPVGTCNFTTPFHGAYNNFGFESTWNTKPINVKVL